MRTKFLLGILTGILIILTVGCGITETISNNVYSIVGLSETATVIAKRANLRSSYAVVAADLLEVSRGDTVDVLEELESEKVKWYRVRAKDEDSTEGWIEEQNLILGTLLEKSKKLADEDKNLQAQAAAQLRAVTNLRLSPEQNPENILLRLDNGTTFDIIGWKYVPKNEETSDIDDVSKNKEAKKKEKTKNADVEAAKEGNEPEEISDKYDIWYKIRLLPSQSPAPVGWIFGRQVELDIPPDILTFQKPNRKFVSWQRIDDVEPEKPSKDDEVKVAKPGSWVILTRSNIAKAKDGLEPDFDGILVMGYDKVNQEHYTIWRSGELWGVIPLTMGGIGDNKTFSVKIKNASGQLEDKIFAIFKDGKGHLKVTPPADISKDDKKDG